MRSYTVLSMALAALLASAPAQAQQAPAAPSISGVTTPPGFDLDAYCFLQTSILRGAFDEEKASADTADMATQREALRIAVPYYAGALSRRFDLAGVNAAVGAALAALKLGHEKGAEHALLCAYEARDRMHAIAQGMRATLAK